MPAPVLPVLVRVFGPAVAGLLWRYRWVLAAVAAVAGSAVAFGCFAMFVIFFNPVTAAAPVAGDPLTVSPSDMAGVAARLGIPDVALLAYVKAAQSADACPGARWQIIAAVYVIESGHGTHAGSYPQENGDVAPPIVNSIGAMGAGQFMPGSWPLFARDGNGDGRMDPQNIYDSAQASLAHLCSSAGGDLLSDMAVRRGMAGYYGADIDGYTRNGAFYLAEYDAGSGQPDRPAQPSAPYAWLQPCDGPVTSGFGYRTAPLPGASTFHRGLDFGCAQGDPVVAAKAGVVSVAAYQGNAGLSVHVDHPDGSRTRYFHLSGVDVAVGQRVTQGQRVGRVGSTGNSTGPHLHFEVWVDGEPVDPARVLR